MKFLFRIWHTFTGHPVKITRWSNAGVLYEAVCDSCRWRFVGSIEPMNVGSMLLWTPDCEQFFEPAKSEEQGEGK